MRGFQKVYDLTERVIPEEHRSATVSQADFVDWACRSALDRLGAATTGEIAAFWDLLTPKESAAWCNTALTTGELIEVLVDCCDKRRPTKAYAFPDIPERLSELADPPSRLRVISPFDPLIRDRKRCSRLFGFDYRIEIFVPKHKRRYGYYVFPLLEGDRFVGQVDMIHKNGTLTVTGFWPEQGVKMGKKRCAALESELERYQRFVGADRVDLACDVR